MGLLAMACCLACAAAVSESQAQEAPSAAYSGPPPRPAEVQLVRNVLVVERPIVQMVPEQRTRTVRVDGAQREESYTVYRPMIVGADQFAVPADDYRIHTLDGKPVDPAEAVQQLESSKVVLLCDSGRLVDPQYLKLYRDDLLLVYIRPQPPRYIAPPPAIEAGPPPAIQPRPAPVPVP
jgi:hypothetical protein